jgi:hypothetical protein
VTRNRLLLLLLAAVVVLPGCFVIAGFGWSRYNIPKGGKAVAHLRVRPAMGDGELGYFFVLIHMLDENEGSRELRVGFPRRFDKKGNFNDPQKMVRDDDLEDMARDNMACSAFAGPFYEDARDRRWFLLRTKRPIRTRGDISKSALVEIGIVDRIMDGNNIAAVHFYTGFWRDNNAPDGPDPGDTNICTSALESTIPIGNGIPSDPTVSAPRILEEEIEDLTE